MKDISSEILHKITSDLSHVDKVFCQRVYNDGIQKYCERLTKLDFVNQSRVLDAGCGFGQWSLALAGLNGKVDAFEYSQQRVNAFQQLIDLLQVNNVEVSQGSLENLPYDSAIFDCCFCYGVIFLTDWRKSLQELSRVLKPGGKLYINFNGPGWYLMLEDTNHNITDNYDPCEVSQCAKLNTIDYENQVDFVRKYRDVIISREQMIKAMQQEHLLPVSITGEGKTNFGASQAKSESSFFLDRYKHKDCVIEVVASKM